MSARKIIGVSTRNIYSVRTFFYVSRVCGYIKREVNGTRELGDYFQAIFIGKKTDCLPSPLRTGVKVNANAISRRFHEIPVFDCVKLLVRKVEAD